MELNKPKDPNNMTDFEKKHTPAIEILGDKVIVKVGDGIVHPMEEEHHIVLIQAFADAKLVVGKRLYPGDAPELELMPKYEGKEITARAYCNVHGLWKSK